jgi:hypothetical protein
LNLPKVDASHPAYLPLYRLPAKLRAAALVWDGD